MKGILILAFAFFAVIFFLFGTVESEKGNETEPLVSAQSSSLESSFKASAPSTNGLPPKSESKLSDAFESSSSLTPSPSRVEQRANGPLPENPIDYVVSQVSFQYGGDSRSLPSLDVLGNAYVRLSISPEEVQVASLFSPNRQKIRLTLSDFHALSEIALQYLKSQGYEGVLAFPNPTQIDPLSGKDLRGRNQQNITIIVWVSRLQKVDLVNEGIPSEHSRLLAQALSRESVKSNLLGQPLRQESFAFWKRVGSSSSVSSRVILVPGDQPGTVRALVEAKPKSSPRFALFASNAGTSTLGKWMIGASYQNPQLTGRGDQVSFQHSRSDTGARQASSVSYRRPVIYPNLLEAGLSLGVSEYDASSFAVTRIDFEGSTKYADAYISWNPMGAEGDRYRLGFELGLRAEELKASNSLMPGQADAHFVLPRAAVTLHYRSKYIRSLSRLQVTGNIESVEKSDTTLLGGVDVKDRSRRFTILHQESFKIGKWLNDYFPEMFDETIVGHSILSQFRAQYGLEKVRLLPQRQFIAGGTGSVRGYPESPAAGDNGFFLSSEYRIPLPSYDTASELGQITSYLIPFVDWAETEVNQPFAYESDRSLLGAGLGLEMKFSSGLFTRLDFATPLKEIENSGVVLEGTRRDDHRVHALIRWEF